MAQRSGQMSSDSSSTKPLSGGLNAKLSTMMFLQYAIWGAWLPLLWPFLNGHRGFSPAEITNMFAVGALGAIVAPFIAGQIADRWFNTEKFLGISHVLGGILVWQLASIETYKGFLLFSLFYSIIYSPTLSLTNSLAFHHLPDRDRDFGRILESREKQQGSVADEVVNTSRREGQDWRYSLRQPPKDWIQSSFDDQKWKKGKGGFGKKGTPGLRLGTDWNTQDIWLRRTFKLKETPRDKLKLSLLYDEDTEVYLNGVLAASVKGFSKTYREVPINPEALKTLKKGDNL